MENRAHALAAGIFTVLLIAALVAAGLWFSGKTAQRSTYLVVSRYSVSGLNPQSTVRFRGVQVGKVEAIKFNAQDTRTILVRINVDDALPITKGTYAKLGYQGVTGLSHIQLDDDGADPAPLPTSAADPARIEMRPSVFDQVSNSGQEVIGAAKEVVARVNVLLSDQNQARFSRILANLETLTGRIDAVAQNVQPSLKKLPALADDAQSVLKRADALLGNLNGVTAQVRERLVTLDRVSKNAERVGESSQVVAETLLSQTLPKANELLDDLGRTTRDLNRLLVNIGDQPQSLVFGRTPAAPGPGEPGFAPSRSRRR